MSITFGEAFSDFLTFDFTNPDLITKVSGSNYSLLFYNSNFSSEYLDLSSFVVGSNNFNLVPIAGDTLTSETKTINLSNAETALEKGYKYYLNTDSGEIDPDITYMLVSTKIPYVDFTLIDKTSIEAPLATSYHINSQLIKLTVNSSLNNVTLTSIPTELQFSMNNVLNFTYVNTIGGPAKLVNITDPSNEFVVGVFNFDSFYVGNVNDGTLLDFKINLEDSGLQNNNTYRLDVPPGWAVDGTGLFTKGYVGDNALYTFAIDVDREPEITAPPSDPTPSEPEPSTPNIVETPVLPPPEVAYSPNQDSKPPKNTGRKIGILIGCIMGGILLMVVGFYYVFWRKRKAKRMSVQSMNVKNFDYM